MARTRSRSKGAGAFSRCILVIALLCICAISSFAQHNNLAAGTFATQGVPGSGLVTSNENQSDTTYRDTTGREKMFGIKDYFHGLAIRDSLKVQHSFFGSILMPGTSQIYNRQTWKLPIIYGTLGGCITGAVLANQHHQNTGSQGSKNIRTACIVGAAAVYYATLLDGVICYKSEKNPLPARHAIYSAMLPGLGQAANGDYWKIPIFYAGFGACAYFWAFNQQQYIRYKNMYKGACEDPEHTWTGGLSKSDIIWYRDKHRRYRDYSVIATILVYALNIIDANVFAHMSDYDISDDMGVTVAPTVIEPAAQSSIAVVQGEGDAPATVIPTGNGYSPVQESALGMTIGFKF